MGKRGAFERGRVRPFCRFPGKGDAREGFKIEVRVALRGGNAAVAEQLLHGAQIRPAFQQMRGKGMAQIVGGDVLRNARLLGPLFQNARGLTPVQPFSASSQKGRPFSVHGRHAVPYGEPAGERCHAGVAERYDALLAALAHNPDVTAFRAHVVHVQAESFGYAQARAVEQFQKRLVPQKKYLVGGESVAGSGCGARCGGLFVQQAENLIHVEHGRMPLILTRIAHSGAGIGLYLVEAQKVMKQGAQCGKLARHGGAGHALAEQRGGKALHHLLRDFGRPLQRGSHAAQVGFKFQNVHGVGRHRGFGGSFLKLHPGKKGGGGDGQLIGDFGKTAHDLAS